MDFKLMATVFATVFFAEIADKTQIATVLYASNSHYGKLTVFLGAAAALVLATAISVVAGSLLSQWISGKVMERIAGLAFVLVGVWTIVRA
jgi:putative Ca2+/H+ antiporter (TMEM165/GDT1 family)